MPATDEARQYLVGILAPHGRDAAVARDFLEREGIKSEVASSMGGLVRAMRDGLGCGLITEESLREADQADLQDAVAAQPFWSNLPFVVLTNGTTGARSEVARTRIDALSNAVLLPRPLHADALVRAVRSALGARGRQYEARVRIDDLHLREAQLRESEAKFHAIADFVDQMIWSTRPDGFHDYYNRRWYEFTGMEEGSTDGEAWNGMFHPEDREAAWGRWSHSLQTGEPYEIEYRLRHRSGAYRWVLGRAQPVRDGSGRILRWYGTCTDIDDEVLARKATVDNLTRQRDAAWSLSQDLISVIDRDGRFEAANPSWTRILGYDPDDLVGMSGMDLIHPDDVEATQGSLAAVIEAPLADPVEFRVRHRDDSYRTISFSASSDGERVVAFGRDVTEARARDAALAASEAALRQSQKLETIGQLTGGVAHDFNNLLMAIRSSLDLLDRRIPGTDARARQLLDNAMQATLRGASLTQRMLAFARKQDLHADAVDVGALLTDLLDLLQRSVGPVVDIAIEVSPDLPPAMVDANQLEMAVLNLAVNGRDAMDGAGKLTLTLDRVEADGTPGADDLDAGAYLRLAVTDTGAGMDAATLAQAMEPFFTTKGVGKGTGLGLPMVHGLAVQTGGTFRMRSFVGSGTTAELYLPVAGAATVPEPVPACIGAAVSDAAPGDAKLTILAVDDDALVLMGTVGLLEDMGHRVFEACSGLEAMEIVEQNPDIDLLVTDQAMPRMTGAELAASARELRPGLPVILASGYAEMPEGAERNIAARLEKPFGPADLARVIAQVRTER